MSDTPTLVILRGDAPSARMLAIRWGAPCVLNADSKWTYVSDRHVNARRRAIGVPVLHPDDLTPLSKFGVAAALSDDGVVTLRQVQPSAATYRDGLPRRWADTGRDQMVTIANPIILDLVRRAITAYPLRFDLTPAARAAE